MIRSLLQHYVRIDEVVSNIKLNILLGILGNTIASENIIGHIAHILTNGSPSIKQLDAFSVAMEEFRMVPPPLVYGGDEKCGMIPICGFSRIE